MKKTLLTVVAALFVSALIAQTSGGPDNYGYTWKNNSDPNGPNYNWIDITTTGTQITGLGDDNFVGPFSIGFNFQYYWTQVDEFYFGSNGYIAFDPIQISSGASGFPIIPLADANNNFVAPMLTDLSFGNSGNPGKAYYYTNNTDTLIITYENVPFWNNISNYSGSNTFQVIFTAADNGIKFQYQSQSGSYDPAYNTATNPVVTGIESGNGQVGLMVSGLGLPTAPTAVQFEYPDTVTYQVVDLQPDWVNNPQNGGFFMLNNTPNIVNASLSNVGNTNISNVFNIDGIITNPIGSTVYNEDFTVQGLNAGVSVPFSYGPLFTPSTMGTHIVTSSINLPTDINTANNVITTELVVIDTAGVSEVALSYTDLQPDANFGIVNQGGATYYMPPFHPTDINGIAIGLFNGDTTAPSDGFKAEIFADDGANGAPGTLLWDTVIASNDVITFNAAALLHAIDIDNPVTITSGGFYVTWTPDSAVTPNTTLLTDITSPFSLRTYEVIDGDFAPNRNAGTEDFFLWAIMSVPAANNAVAPVADFASSAASACISDAIDFFNHSIGATTYNWTFNGGTPGSSTNADPSVSWSAAGTFDVKLVATNAFGTDSITKQITVLDDPTAGAVANPTTVQLGNGVTFLNNSTNFNTTTWNFGDGSTATTQNSSHTYADTGTYTVTLTVENSCGNDMTTVTIVVIDTTGGGTTGIVEATMNAINLMPNPTTGFIQVQFEENGAWEVAVINSLGEVIMNSFTTSGDNIGFDLSQQPNGLYWIRAFKDGNYHVTKFLVQH